MFLIELISRTLKYHRTYGLSRTMSAVYQKLCKIGAIPRYLRRSDFQRSTLTDDSSSSSISEGASHGISPVSKMPLVSVIIASYNHAAFVSTAVTSVLEQYPGDIEVIVVDDGSNDGTPDVVAGIKDPRVQLIRLNQNRRVHPRNMGLQLARGRYVAFQNSDDEWASGKLLSQIEVLESNRKIVACFTGVEIIDEKGKQSKGTWANGLFSTENRTNVAWLRYFFDSGNCLCLPSAVIRLDEIRMVGGFRGSLIQLSDLDLWVRLAAIGDFHVIDKGVTRVRIIPGNNVSRHSPSGQRRSRMEYCEVLWRYTEHPVLSHVSQTFVDVLPVGGVHSISSQLAGLALHALALGDTAHRIFADRVLARLLDDCETREKVVTAYGTGIVHDFIKNRGELEVITKPGEKK